MNKLFLGTLTLTLLISVNMIVAQPIDPDWERSGERHGDYWWHTAKDGTPNVVYYGNDTPSWTWDPATNPWPNKNGDVYWFKTPDGGSTANSWFRATIPPPPAMNLVSLTLTSKPDEGIGINDGIYIFLDGEFTGQWASVSVADYGSPCDYDYFFPTGWRTTDLTIQVNDDAPMSHEIAVAFEEYCGWGGLTKLRVVAEYNNVQAIETLITTVESLELPKGIENSLVKKLEAAINSLDRGNEVAAVNQLNAFINHVKAQSGKKLTQEDADSLIEIAERIIASIESVAAAPRRPSLSPINKLATTWGSLKGK